MVAQASRGQCVPQKGPVPVSAEAPVEAWPGLCESGTLWNVDVVGTEASTAGLGSRNSVGRVTSKAIGVSQFKPNG